MKPTKFIAGIFNDPELICRAADGINKAGMKVYDCYTPFVVHGLDSLLGIKRTKLSIAAFIYGCTGFLLAVLMQSYMYYLDWPINIGGKPLTPVLPTFVPVCFEMTVLFTALGTIMTFWIKSKMFHGVKPDLFDPRQTSDLFVLAMDAEKYQGKSEEIMKILKANGAIEVKEQSFEKNHSLIQ